jgi:Tol biopolymer transport system component
MNSLLIRVCQNKFYDIKDAKKPIIVLVLLIAGIVSSCNTQTNATLLYKDDHLPASNLVWSPDGNQLAITGIIGNPPVSTIHILDITTGKARLLINQDFGHVYAQGWTPDSNQLGFTAFSYEDSKKGTWLVDPRGIKPPEFLFGDYIIAWSPTGEMLLSRKNTKTQEVSVYLKDTQNGVETQIFSGKGIGINVASWSSNGSKLVFLFLKDFAPTRNGIYIFDTKTKKTIQVIPDGNITDPSLSPDGQMIAYSKGSEKGILPTSYLHIVNSDGSCDLEVPGKYDTYSPVWSPDGKWIAHIGKYDAGIYLLDLAGAFGKDILLEGLPCS